MRARCAPPIRIASFNIRMFPEPRTDPRRVATVLAGLEADIVGVQEIASAAALRRVLATASAASDRDYRSMLSRCREPRSGITNGLLWDAARVELLEAWDFPDLRADDGGSCGRGQPGIAGLFEDVDGERVGVVVVHLDAFAHGYPNRRRQWQRTIAIQQDLAARWRAPVLAVGDFNSTGFTTEPPQEPGFVRGVVRDAGFSLLTDAVACTEYYRPAGEPNYLPSILDHVVASGGDFEPAEVHGLCARLRCAVTPPSQMDPDFFAVSDHCPVVVRGRL